MELPVGRSRGQPLRLLVLLLSAWTMVRAVVWSPPPLLAGAARQLAAVDWLGWIVLAPPVVAKPRGPDRDAKAAMGTVKGDAHGAFASAWRQGPGVAMAGSRANASLQFRPSLTTASVEYSGDGTGDYSNHPDEPTSLIPTPGLQGFSGMRASGRWSLDSWLLVRDRAKPGGGFAGYGAGYGGSQAGAVLRYSLADAIPGASAYARVSGALDAGAAGYREAAAGLSLQPLSGVPLAALGEVRVQQSDDETFLRPAVAVVTLLPPQTLPLGVRAEIYGQAGYVGGTDATGFFDGQVVLDRPVLLLGKSGTVNLGAGAWAGGQRGAQRLDIGPEVQVRVASARMAGRIALDWRWRVAGNAEPGSGPALVVSVGF